MVTFSLVLLDWFFRDSLRPILGQRFDLIIIRSRSNIVHTHNTHGLADFLRCKITNKTLTLFDWKFVNFLNDFLKLWLSHLWDLWVCTARGRLLLNHLTIIQLGTLWGLAWLNRGGVSLSISIMFRFRFNCDLREPSLLRLACRRNLIRGRHGLSWFGSRLVNI